MKTVDNVDKSGLSIAAGCEELTEKDFRCIAMHLKYFKNMELGKGESPFPCQMCYDTFPEEKCCPMPDYNFPFVLGKLDKITGTFI